MELCSDTLSILCTQGGVVVMKASSKPFYQQKVFMDLGNLLTAFILLFIVGSIDTRSEEQKNRHKKSFIQEPAFWKERELGDGAHGQEQALEI